MLLLEGSLGLGNVAGVPLNHPNLLIGLVLIRDAREELVVGRGAQVAVQKGFAAVRALGVEAGIDLDRRRALAPRTPRLSRCAWPRNCVFAWPQVRAGLHARSSDVHSLEGGGR